ncbi:hypothetical protein GGQ22_04050 [Nocardioides sp. zg-579]|uniref:Big-1 domain-containing protein n=1 Tax=Nocardioides marmotae TaxID=2663857 RepID=A0A6I3J7T8_9ACTN|nr:hypothetical protein [Nocardioides marmotae]MCR6030613.1 hypothetical protein [Gordonia jinghuaiqii]MTB94249.1 hypothetical protein [Nocardioides marmotae]QKE00528.1 hypothetical protein HPC71_05130 [Nocardioides marmotae]
MRSIGFKRGLAAASVSALAVTGLPIAASATSVADQVGAGKVVLYSQFNSGNEASSRADGTDGTIRLAAGAGSDVSAVTFSYSVGGGYDTIATVSERNDDGLFTSEWTPPASAQGTTVTLRASATVGGSTVNADRASVEVAAPGGTANTVNLAQGAQLGVFQQPYGLLRNDQLVRVSGTTSATSGNVAISRLDGNGASQDSDNIPVTTAPGATTGVFAGAYDITGYPYAEGAVDQIVLGADRDTDDVEGYTLYRQTITTVAASADRTQVPAGQDATVTVKVTDQNGAPVVGAEVRSSAGLLTLPQYTDADGLARFDQGAGSAYYYANATNGDSYEESLGDKRSAEIAVTQYSATPAKLLGESADGAAFDRDESADGDITVQVQDQNGNDQAVALRTVRYYWVITPFDGSPATVRSPATGTSTTRTDLNGQATIPLPADQESGTYELFAELAAAPLIGTGAIASSKVLTVKTGEASVGYAAAGPEQATAGTSHVVTGSLELEDGTGLAGRPIALTFQRGTESGPGAGTAGDAGFADASGAVTTTRTVTTGNDGSFTVTVKDPTENPQPEEKGGNIDAVPTGNTDGATNDHGVDFLKSVAAGKVEIAPETPLSQDGKTPGRPVSSQVTVSSAEGAPLANQTVTLTTDKGFFTPYAATAAELTPDPAPAAGSDAGEFKDSGTSITVRTDNQGVARFTLAIERDTGFDDDGKVDATVTATVGGVNDTETVDWTSANPVNGGKVRVELAPDAAQESGVLPKAPISDEVFFDLFTEDQFGNLVGGETVGISDDAPGAQASAATAQSDFAKDGDFSVTATAGGSAAVTASWQTEANRYSAATPPVATPGTETVTGSQTVEFYEVDYAASTFTLGHSGADTQRTGSTVTSTYTALDQNGEPIADLFVQFFRSGPDGNGNGEGSQTGGLLGQDGTLEYVFQGGRAGVATITAVGRQGSANGVTVPAAQRTDRVTFTGGGTSLQAIVAKLTGTNLANGKDKLTIKATPKAKGAKVKLFKVKANGKRVLVSTGKLGAKGKKAFTVKDTNGKTRTTYIAVVAKTARTKADTTAKTAVK